MPKKIEDHEAEFALDTLVRADEIKKNSKLMKKIKNVASSREKALKKITKKASPKSNPHKKRKY